MNIGFISAESFDEISAAIGDLINQMWPPCISIASALSLIWGLYIGYKFWVAGGDETKKKSAKSALASFFIGIIVIFAIVVVAPMLIGALTTWVLNYV